MIGSRKIRIEAEIEMLLPVERGSRFGQFIIAVAGVGDAQGNVGGVGGDFVRNTALLDVVLFG